MAIWREIISWVLICSFCFGCTSTQRLTQEHLRVDADRDILVYTNDGRIIKFNAGEYKVIDENLGSIQGKGKLYMNKSQTDFKKFEGVISFSEIQEITETKETTFGKIAIYSFIGVGAILLLLILNPPKISNI